MSDRRYPLHPLLGVGAVLFSPDHQHVLLIRRAAPPAKGLWSIPGGLVEVGEPLRDACQREVREETGLDAALSEVAKVVERIIPDDQGRVEYHYLIVDFVGTTQGEPQAGSDAGEVAWCSVGEIGRLHTTRGLPEAIERGLRIVRGEAVTDSLYEVFLGES